MPYKTISDLPDKIKSHLPNHAQEIYLKTFNSAWEEYKNPKKRNKARESQEIVAHKVAWAAVKAKYHKTSDGSWKEN